MSNIPVTIRLPEKELSLIDNFAFKKGYSRSDLLKEAIISLSSEIREIMIKENLLIASQKVNETHLFENNQMDDTLLDGLDKENE